jgi:hypothetical protein
MPLGSINNEWLNHDRKRDSRVFVYLCICIKKSAKKTEHQLKIHKIASGYLFSGSSTLLFCVLLTFTNFQLNHSLKTKFNLRQSSFLLGAV